MAYGDISNFELTYLAKQAVDSTKKQYALLEQLDQNKSIKEVPGTDGTVSVPLILRAHSQTKEMASEDTLMDMTFTDVSDRGVWNFSACHTPIGISRVASKRNQGAESEDAWEARLKTVVETQMYQLNSRIVGNVSDHNKFSGVMSLNGLTGGVGQTGGLFTTGAFGSQTGSVGGVSKAANPATWQHQYASAGGAFATGGLDAVSLLIALCRKYSGKAPHIGLASQTCWQLFRKALRTDFGPMAVQVADTQKYGHQAFMFDGVPIDFDIDLGNAGASTTGLFSLALLNLEDLQLYHAPDSWFEVTMDGDDSKVYGTGFVGKLGAVSSDVALTTKRLTGHGVLVHGQA